MTIITKLQGILKPEHREKGMYITEEADDFVHLYQDGKRLATFGLRATLEEIRAEADKHITDPRQIVMNIE
jgi:hypothetical protein